MKLLNHLITAVEIRCSLHSELIELLKEGKTEDAIKVAENYTPYKTSLLNIPQSLLKEPKGFLNKVLYLINAFKYLNTDFTGAVRVDLAKAEEALYSPTRIPANGVKPNG